MESLFLIEWFGYAATIVVGVSLLMKSIVKLRWINMTGAIMFSIYGYFIGSMPVLVLNSFLSLINAVYLYQIYTQSASFKLVPVAASNSYLLDFLDFHKLEISQFLPNFEFNASASNENFFILRNMQIAGLLLAHRHDSHTLMIDLDFAAPEFRDFKLGDFLYSNQDQYFKSLNYQRIICRAQSRIHNKYLHRNGFRPIQISNENWFAKGI